jgi:hypothetical protein
MREQDLKIEMDLAKAWQSLNESILPENGLAPFDDVRNAEVVGKGSELDSINMTIQTCLEKPEAIKAIRKRIATSIHEMFLDCPATNNIYVSEYDLDKYLKQLILEEDPSIENYLIKMDNELEEITDYYSILANKIAELAEQDIPQLINACVKRIKQRNTRT